MNPPKFSLKRSFAVMTLRSSRIHQKLFPTLISPRYPPNYSAWRLSVRVSRTLRSATRLYYTDDLFFNKDYQFPPVEYDHTN